MIEALGGTVVDYAGVYKCCGFPIITMNKEASLTQAGRHLGDAIDADADCLVVPCPLCHLNLDLQQPVAAKVVGRELGMPVLHLPQLVGLALGSVSQGARDEQAHRAADRGDRLVDLGGGRGLMARPPGAGLLGAAAVRSSRASWPSGRSARRRARAPRGGSAPGSRARAPQAANPAARGARAACLMTKSETAVSLSVIPLWIVPLEDLFEGPASLVHRLGMMAESVLGFVPSGG